MSLRGWEQSSLAICGYVLAKREVGSSEVRTVLLSFLEIILYSQSISLFASFHWLGADVYLNPDGSSPGGSALSGPGDFTNSTLIL